MFMCCALLSGVLSVLDVIKNVNLYGIPTVKAKEKKELSEV